ncbi:MAG: hypothetical protein IJY27_00880 [Clostridia bacterium]|nr:hypothetical protein [Clostridia bacterium]
MQDKINHIIWGTGSVVSQDGKYICVAFDDSEVGFKTFIYPDAFSHYLCYEDAERQAEAQCLIDERRRVEEAEKAIELQKQQQAALAARAKEQELLSKRRRALAYSRSRAQALKKSK